MKRTIGALRDALGERAVVCPPELSQRATSYWNSDPTNAVAMILPEDTHQVSLALRLCHQHRQPVVVQGGRTNCVAGAEAGADELILSLERMNRIESVDAVGGTVTAQAGVVLQTLQEQLAEQDLLFPLDLGARGSCTIGGNAASNAGGINVLRYGMMRNLVLGMEVVLADGTVLSSMNHMLKNNAGYDLKQVFIGSEGTLGVVTRLVLRLFPRPRSCNSALVALADFGSITALLQRLKRDLGDTLSAFEVMWGEYFRAVTEPGGHRAPMSREFPFYVMIEAEGADPDSDNARFTRVLEAALEAGELTDAVVPKSETERRAIWDIRENFEVLLETGPNYLYDVSLPILAMDDYIGRLQASLQAEIPGCLCYVLGHIADGNLHLFVKPQRDEDLHGVVDAAVYGPLEPLGGSVSAEHGIGIDKRAWLPHSRSRVEIEVMRSLKATLDPQGILGRGRIFST